MCRLQCGVRQRERVGGRREWQLPGPVTFTITFFILSVTVTLAIIVL